jgi:hypothetical protein
MTQLTTSILSRSVSIVSDRSPRQVRGSLISISACKYVNELESYRKFKRIWKDYQLDTQGVDNQLSSKCRIQISRNPRWLSDKMRSKNVFSRDNKKSKSGTRSNSINILLFTSQLNTTTCGVQAVSPNPRSRLIPDPTETALLFLLHIYSSR